MSHRPIRTCVACGKKEEKGKLLRITYQGGKLRWDERMRLGGRGVYLCPKRECVERLRKRRGRERLLYCLRQQIPAEEVEAFLEGLLEREEQWGRVAR